MDKPLLELRPNIGVAMIPFIFGGIIFIFFILFIARIMWLVRSSSISFTAVFLGGLFAYLLMAFFNFMNLRARKYLFYNDKAEFYEGFINITQRTVRYTKVTDCILRKKIIDRIFGTGSISLITAGHDAGYGKTMVGGGISIDYINDPDKIYSYVEKLLKKH